MNAATHSSTSDGSLTPAAVREQANAWYVRQRELAARCLGSSWPEHAAWVDSYLREELRQRLIAIGWRPADGR